MKELTNDEIDDVWAGASDPAQDTIDMHDYARAIIAADRALNASQLQMLTGGDDRRHIICLCPDCVKPNALNAPADRDVMRQTPKLKGSPFESYVAQLLHAAWIDGWASCRDAEFVGDDAMNDAFNQCITLNACMSIEQTPSAEQQPASMHAHRCAMNHFAFASCDCGVAKIAKLRAKVEALRGEPKFFQDEDDHYISMNDVLAEIDKMGGGV